MVENDTSTPNKIAKNFNDIILTKSVLSGHTGVGSKNGLITIQRGDTGRQSEPPKHLRFFEEESSAENSSISKLENEDHKNRSSVAVRTEENCVSEPLKVRKKFSNDYYNERKRPGLPTLTQKKRDLTPLLEIEGIETQSWKDSENPNVDENVYVQKTEEKSKNYINNELENIERLKHYKKKMENFVMLFNNKPQDGIKYLVENKIKTTQEDIANLLLTYSYEGLSKEILGQYFGCPDTYNQEIFNYFCSSLDFRNLELDQALRLLLSRFRLPGEAQQIDRIVQIFSKKYMNDNPAAFLDEDTPYILSYSAIMLSTDAHSSNIPLKNKMKKHQFVETNKRICPSVSLDFLEGMFDRIVSQKFETQTDCNFLSQMKSLK